MELFIGILQVSGFYLALPILVGFMIVGSLQLSRRFRVGARVKYTTAGPACSTNADCPEGYVCQSGVCVPVANVASSS